MLVVVVVVVVVVFFLLGKKMARGKSVPLLFLTQSPSSCVSWDHGFYRSMFCRNGIMGLG